MDDKLAAKASIDKAMKTVTGVGGKWDVPAEDRADIIEDVADALDAGDGDAALSDFEGARSASYLRAYAAHVDAHFCEPVSLPGPTGERNELSMVPRGPVLCLAAGGGNGICALAAQAGAALATGNAAVLFHPDPGVAEASAKLFIKAGVDKNAIAVVETGTDATLADVVGAAGIEAVAYAGPLNFAAEINRTLAAADAAIRPVIYFREDPAMDAGAGQPLAGSPNYVERFVHERSLSIDTTASGGNASLLSIEDGGTSLPGEA